MSSLILSDWDILDIFDINFEMGQNWLKAIVKTIWLQETKMLGLNFIFKQIGPKLIFHEKII